MSKRRSVGLSSVVALAALIPALAGWKLHPGHPRVLFRQGDVPKLKQRIQSTHGDQWRTLRSYASQHLHDAPSSVVSNAWNVFQIIPSDAFICLMTGESRFCDHARRCLVAAATIDPRQGGDMAARFRLWAMGLGYDWAYDHLSASDRAAVQQGIVRHLNAWHDFIDHPNFIAGHSRKGNYDALTALSAVADESHSAMSYLQKVRNNWVNGYNPTQGWIAVDGGYQMGWSYTGGYVLPMPYWVWDTAAEGETLIEPWQGKFAWFYLYGMRGDGTWPRLADCYAIRPQAADGYTVLHAANVSRDPHAMWLYRQWRNSVMTGGHIVYDIIEHDTTMPAKDPSDLPLARCFRNAGFLLARDSWDQHVSLLVFKSSSFSSIGHQHLDNNHIALSYRGQDLLQDTGVYDAWASSHWKNYYTRTVAHNSLLVFDPNEHMTFQGQAVSNDGGQFFRSASTAKDIMPGGSAHLDGLLACGNAKDSAYALGDATKGYQSSKLQRFHRHVAYVRDVGAGWKHPVIVVLDDVRAKAGLRRTDVWHVPSRPTMHSTRVQAAGGSGTRVVMDVLEPAGASIEAVGGPGHEFWVDGRNYPPSKLSGPQAPGAWRVEVSTSASSVATRFLSVIFPSDSTDPEPPASKQISSTSGAMGAVVGGATVVFVPRGEDSATVSYRFDCPAAGRSRQYLYGLESSKVYSVTVNGTSEGTVDGTAWGSVTFDVGCEGGAGVQVTVSSTGQSSDPGGGSDAGAGGSGPGGAGGSGWGPGSSGTGGGGNQAGGGAQAEGHGGGRGDGEDGLPSAMAQDGGARLGEAREEAEGCACGVAGGGGRSREVWWWTAMLAALAMGGMRRRRR